MIVLMDVGNSRIKWGWLDDDRSLQVGQPVSSGGDFVAALSSRWADRLKPTRVVMSNVAGGAVQSRLQQWLQRDYGIVAECVVSCAQAHGVRNAYRRPERLGCDRWLALIALRHGWRGAVCVLDVGTAATFDALDAEGRHQGGAIVPGVDLMARSLQVHTAQIADVRPTGQGGLGLDTADAIRIGALHAIAGMAERLRAQAASRLGGQPVAAVLTGGDAPLLADYLSADWQVAPDLLLQGLAIIARGER